MRRLGLQGAVPGPHSSRPHPERVVYPDLLGHLGIDRPDLVCSSDSTDVPMARGYLYLAAVIDWYSRSVLAWALSSTLESAFCVDALATALALGEPVVFNTDPGAQFTSAVFTGRLKQRQIRISMDGRGRALDNVFIERLWRTLKYADISLRDDADGHALHHGLERYCALHTWGQTLQLHPHLHCLATGGALKRDGSAFIQAPKNFRFPVRALSPVFRANFLRGLKCLRTDGALGGGPPELADAAAFKRLMLRLHRDDWVVYAERPSAEPQHLFRYLGRQVNRIAISNHRLVAIDDRTVTCRYRDGLQGPQGTGSGEADAPARCRIPPPLPPARATAGLPPGPLLRPARRWAALAKPDAMLRPAQPCIPRCPLHRRAPRQARHRPQPLPRLRPAPPAQRLPAPLLPRPAGRIRRCGLNGSPAPPRPRPQSPCACGGSPHAWLRRSAPAPPTAAQMRAVRQHTGVPATAQTAPGPAPCPRTSHAHAVDKT